MNKPEKKNHITISIDEVKVFDTVKYSFMTLKNDDDEPNQRSK